MREFLIALVAAIASVAASSGFWAYMMAKYNRNTAEAKMLRGIGHDMIVSSGSVYLERGYILVDEYENLHDYLFVPYKELGGNGSAEKIMEHVKKLPIYSQPPRKDVPNET